LRDVGTITETDDGRFKVTLGPNIETIDPQHGHDIGQELAADLRRMLSAAGITPESLSTRVQDSTSGHPDSPTSCCTSVASRAPPLALGRGRGVSALRLGGSHLVHDRRPRRTIGPEHLGAAVGQAIRTHMGTCA
jgi:hypothetical protein